MAKQILIHPKAMQPPFNDRIFEETDTRCGIFYGPYWRLALREVLRKRGYDLRTIDLGDIRKAEKIIFISMHNDVYFKQCIKHGLNDKMVLYEVEFPLNPDGAETCYPSKEYRDKFGKVLTWNDDLVDKTRIFKMHRPNNWYRERIILTPFKTRKLLVMINSNKYSNYVSEQYSLRREAILFFQENCRHRFDLYGSHWDRSILRYITKRTPFIHYNEKGLIRKTEKSLRIDRLIRLFLNEPDYSKCYRGWTTDPIQTMSKHCFSIIYECVGRMKGSISSKIFESFLANCIPIYLGATNITDYLPSNTFIDKRRYSYKELLEYVDNIETGEYEEYLANIKSFLGKEGRIFFEEDWAEYFCDVLLGDDTQ